MALGNLAQRFLVAVVAVPILLGILYVQRPEPTWALIFIASLIAMHEFFAMTLPKEDRRAALVLGAIAVLLFYWLDPLTLGWYRTHHRDAFPHSIFQATVIGGSSIAVVFAVVAPMLFFLFRFRDIATVASRTTATVMGIVYAGFLTTFLVKLKVFELGADRDGRGYMVLIVLLVAWLADTGGYFAGRFLGKAKLYEAVSPKKTWAGAWGGLAGSFVGVAVLKLAFVDYLSWVDVVVLSVVGGMLGQMGDLAESLIKRSTGVKDSGALLPGHGGILDRIDAVLFIAPFVHFYLLFKFL